MIRKIFPVVVLGLVFLTPLYPLRADDSSRLRESLSADELELLPPIETDLVTQAVENARLLLETHCRTTSRTSLNLTARRGKRGLKIKRRCYKLTIDLWGTMTLPRVASILETLATNRHQGVEIKRSRVEPVESVEVAEEDVTIDSGIEGGFLSERKSYTRLEGPFTLSALNALSRSLLRITEAPSDEYVERLEDMVMGLNDLHPEERVWWIDLSVQASPHAIQSTYQVVEKLIESLSIQEQFQASSTYSEVDQN